MKRAIFVIAALVLVPAALSLSGCSRGAASGGRSTLEIGGSTSVAPAMELLAAAYMEANPSIRINVNGTGSSDGIRNAGALYQIGMTSRDLTPAELGMGLNQQVIAIDGIAVIVHGSSPLRDLSLERIRAIYTGEITDWSEVSDSKSGPIAVVTREEGSGTRGAFEELAGFPGRLRPGAVEGPSTGAVRSAVAGNPNAIGYVSLGSVDASVRAIRVDGIEATVDGVRSGAYRIARPFILLYNDLHPAGKAFLDWVISDGQSIVAGNWIPIN